MPLYPSHHLVQWRERARLHTVIRSKLVTWICANEWGQCWFRWWLVTNLSPSRFTWNGCDTLCIHILPKFVQEISFEIVVCIMGAIYSGLNVLWARELTIWVTGSAQYRPQRGHGNSKINIYIYPIRLHYFAPLSGVMLPGGDRWTLVWAPFHQQYFPSKFKFDWKLILV